MMTPSRKRIKGIQRSAAKIGRDAVDLALLAGKAAGFDGVCLDLVDAFRTFE